MHPPCRTSSRQTRSQLSNSTYLTLKKTTKHTAVAANTKKKSIQSMKPDLAQFPQHTTPSFNQTHKREHAVLSGKVIHTKPNNLTQTVERAGTKERLRKKDRRFQALQWL